MSWRILVLGEWVYHDGGMEMKTKRTTITMNKPKPMQAGSPDNFQTPPEALDPLKQESKTTINTKYMTPVAMNFIRRFVHNILGWHKPRAIGSMYCDGSSLHSVCRYCCKEIMQDSQGNWFLRNNHG